MQATWQFLDITKDKREISKKEKEKRKMIKSHTTMKIFFTFTFFLLKNILLENIFEKT